MEIVHIWTDGSCLRDGRGGWGAVLWQPSVERYQEIYGSAKSTTNNRMELQAAINALELLKDSCEVLLTSDSEYVIKNMKRHYPFRWKAQGWRISSGATTVNIDLWEQMIIQHYKHKIEYLWVKGHAGNPTNEIADRLATEAARYQLKMGSKGDKM